MKPLTYVVSKEAFFDLEEIWFYTKQTWSVEQADRYYSLIFDEIEYICKNPNTGKSIEHVREGYRTSKVKSHLIFYRINNSVVEIIRILHERMDIDNEFSNKSV